MNTIRYTIEAVDPHAHLFRVTIGLNPHTVEPLRLTLPAWIPGSYMIRDFARNIIQLSASDDDGQLNCAKTDKQSWLLHHHNKPISISYQIYAWDLSVRSAHLDANHGFFNGTSMFLAIEDQTDNPCEVNIIAPQGEAYQHWRVATGLTRAADTDVFSFGRYLADNYQHLIDCPVEMADFDCVSFDCHGITHHLVYTGKHFGDLARVSRDVKTLCDHHLTLFDTKPDIKEYWFLTYITDNGFGGLEHGNSTALICSRFDLPSSNAPDKTEDGYKTYLSLCSHEYFHTWNVKRIKPAEFIPYALEQESYTEQLWAYEGFTSYYDDFSLLRTGLISQEDYLLLLAKTFSRVYRASGRFKQSVAQSSFDAWTKFYKQDENANNAIISYYTKGSMIALCLDLMLRKNNPDKSLDDVMRLLWQHHGLKGIGTGEADFFSLINQVYSGDISEFLTAAIHGTDDLPLAPLLAEFGVELSFRAPSEQNDLNGIKDSAEDQPSLGILYKQSPEGVVITQVLDDGAAQLAGLAAKDTLLALDGLKVTAATLPTLLAHIPRGKTVIATVFREDALLNMEITIKQSERFVAQLVIVDQNKAANWLSVR